MAELVLLPGLHAVPATYTSELVPATARPGATLNVTSEPLPDLLASGSVTYARATFTGSSERHAAGSLVPYAPQLTARADLAFTPRLGEVGRFGALRSHLGAGATHFGRRPLPYGETGHGPAVDGGRAPELDPRERFAKRLHRRVTYT
jgi:hypothetical protein